MAKTVDQLLIEIKAETSQLQKDLKQVKSKLGESNKEAKKFKVNMRAVAAALASIGAGVAIKGIVDTTRKFEDLNATLKAITGSADTAALSFDVIRQFTAQTTFQLDSVAQAFITLLQAGIVPTEDALMDFGNLAAAFGKDISLVAQATFRAITGEMEMLKQFNVIARIEGDKLKMTFDGVSTEIDRNGRAVADYLRNIAQMKFPTAVADRANTLSGAFSNLSDAFAEFQLAIGDQFKGVLTEIVKDMTELLYAAQPLAQVIGYALKFALIAVGKPLLFLVENFKWWIGAALPLVFMGLRAAVVALSYGFFFAYSNLLKLNTAMLRFNALSKASRLNVILAAIGVLIVPLADLVFGFSDYNEEVDDTIDINEQLAASLEKPLPFLQRLGVGLKAALGTMQKFGVATKTTDQEIRELMNFEGGPLNALKQLENEYIAGRIQEMKGSTQGRSSLGLSNESRMITPRGGGPPEMRFSDVIVDFDKYKETYQALREEFFSTEFSGSTEEDVLRRIGLMSLGDLDPLLQDIRTAITDTFQDGAQIQTILDDHAKGGTMLTDMYNNAGGAAAFYGKTLEALVPILGQMLLDHKDLSDVAANMLDTIAKSKDPLRDLKKITDDNKESFRDYFDEISEKYPEMFRDFEHFVEEYNIAMDKMDKTAKKTGKTFSGELKDAVVTASNSFTNEFVSSLLEGENALQAFRDFAKNIVSQIISIFLQMAIVNKIINQVFGLEGDDALTTIDLKKKAAGGGSAYPHQPMLVGERGPELFIPHTAGNIANGMNTRNMLGGGTPIVVNQSINLSTGVVGTVRSEVMNMMPQIAEATKGAVAESARRGGTYRKAFQG